MWYTQTHLPLQRSPVQAEAREPRVLHNVCHAASQAARAHGLQRDGAHDVTPGECSKAAHHPPAQDAAGG